jgi:hypothetical protein
VYVPTRDPSTDTIPASPPPEVLAQVELAARVCDELADRGLRVRFALAPSSPGLCVTAVGPDGSVRRRLAPSAVLDLADGSLAPDDLIRG